jgi:hypothetical protein
MFRLSFPSILSCFRGQIRTIYGPAKRSCTSSVHGLRLGEVVASFALIGMLATSEVRAADPTGITEQQRLEAQGWLQLKQDQKTYREGVEPLPPREEKSLDRLELRQRRDARELGQRQRQSVDTLRNRPRDTDGSRSARRRIELEGRQQLERQRLDMRIQRETLRPGLR